MTLAELAVTLLDAFVAQLEAQDVPVPERRYVAPGSVIAEDGEQLAVILGLVGQGQPGKPEPGTYVPGSEILMAQFDLQLIRTIPALNGEGFPPQMIPGAVALGESGVQLINDAEALVKAAIAIHAAKTVTEAALQGFAIGPASPLGPEGGLAGTRILVEIGLDG